MRDPALEHQLENLKHLMAAWQRFQKYLTETRHRQDFTQGEEAAFLKLKSQIAILHDTLVDVVGTGDRDEANTVQIVIDIVERSILLRQMARQSTAEMKRMEIEWHDGYLLMNDRIGVLEDEVQRLSHISEFHHNVNIWKRRITQHVMSVVGSRGVQSGAAIVVIIAAGVILPALGVYDYGFLDKNPNGKKVHDWGRRVLRKSVYGGLAFRTWEEYRWAVNEDSKGKGLPGGEITGDKTSFKSQFFGYAQSKISKISGINAEARKILDAASDLHAFEDKQKTRGVDYPVRIAIAYFRKSAEASGLYREFDEWVKGKDLTDTDKGLLLYGLRGNVIVLIDTTHPTIAVRAYDRTMGTNEEEKTANK